MSNPLCWSIGGDVYTIRKSEDIKLSKGTRNSMFSNNFTLTRSSFHIKKAQFVKSCDFSQDICSPLQDELVCLSADTVIDHSTGMMRSFVSLGGIQNELQINSAHQPVKSLYFYSVDRNCKMTSCGEWKMQLPDSCSSVTGTNKIEKISFIDGPAVVIEYSHTNSISLADNSFSRRSFVTIRPSEYIFRRGFGRNFHHEQNKPDISWQTSQHICPKKTYSMCNQNIFLWNLRQKNADEIEFNSTLMDTSFSSLLSASLIYTFSRAFLLDKSYEIQRIHYPFYTIVESSSDVIATAIVKVSFEYNEENKRTANDIYLQPMVEGNHYRLMRFQHGRCISSQMLPSNFDTEDSAFADLYVSNRLVAICGRNKTVYLYSIEEQNALFNVSIKDNYGLNLRCIVEGVLNVLVDDFIGNGLQKMLIISRQSTTNDTMKSEIVASLYNVHNNSITCMDFTSFLTENIEKIQRGEKRKIRRKRRRCHDTESQSGSIENNNRMQITSNLANINKKESKENNQKKSNRKRRKKKKKKRVNTANNENVDKNLNQSHVKKRKHRRKQDKQNTYAISSSVSHSNDPYSNRKSHSKLFQLKKVLQSLQRRMKSGYDALKKSNSIACEKDSLLTGLRYILLQMSISNVYKMQKIQQLRKKGFLCVLRGKSSSTLSNSVNSSDVTQKSKVSNVSGFIECFKCISLRYSIDSFHIVPVISIEITLKSGNIYNSLNAGSPSVRQEMSIYVIALDSITDPSKASVWESIDCSSEYRNDVVVFKTTVTQQATEAGLCGYGTQCLNKYKSFIKTRTGLCLQVILFGGTHGSKHVGNIYITFEALQKAFQRCSNAQDEAIVSSPMHRNYGTVDLVVHSSNGDLYGTLSSWKNFSSPKADSLRSGMCNKNIHQLNNDFFTVSTVTPSVAEVNIKAFSQMGLSVSMTALLGTLSDNTKISRNGACIKLIRLLAHFLRALKDEIFSVIRFTSVKCKTDIQTKETLDFCTKYSLFQRETDFFASKVMSSFYV